MTWFMTTSLQTRNYFVGHSGDTYLRLMLFWAIFMPLGEHFSLDRIRLGNSFSREKTHYRIVAPISHGRSKWKQCM